MASQAISIQIFRLVILPLRFLLAIHRHSTSQGEHFGHPDCSVPVGYSSPFYVPRQAFWFFSCVHAISGQFKRLISILTCVEAFRWHVRRPEFAFFGAVSCLPGSSRPNQAVVRVKTSILAFQSPQSDIRRLYSDNFNFSACLEVLVTVFPARIPRCRHSIRLSSCPATFVGSKCVGCSLCL